jgi:hypothetical protein
VFKLGGDMKITRTILIALSITCFLGCVHLQKPSLNKSAMQGNMDEVKGYLKSGSNINEQDQSGRTPLMNSISYRRIGVAKYLIDSGANVKIKDAYGYDALIIAIDLGQDGYSLIEPLLDRGADPNSRDSGGWTPLMHTISSFGGLNTARLLIKRGADLNAKEPAENRTVYQLALYYKNSEVASEIQRALVKGEKDPLSSKLIFIRENAFFHKTRWAEVTVGENTVNLHNGSTNFIDVKPGKCDIVIKGSFGEGNYVTSFDAESSKVHYFEIYPRSGNVASGFGGMLGRVIEASASGDKSGPFEIRQLDEITAKEKIKALTEGMK